MYNVAFGAATVGRILLIRDGNIVADYGDTRITDADYATGLTAAIAAAQAGDTIAVHGVQMATSGNGIDLNKSNICMIWENSKVVPSGFYDRLFSCTGDDCFLKGVTADGLEASNGVSGNDGYGIFISGDRVRAERIEASRTRGSIATAGTALYLYQNKDCIIDGFYSYGAGYSAIISDDSNRAVYKNFTIIDPLDRAVNVQGSDDIEAITFENTVGVMTPGTGASLGVVTNFNTVGTIGTMTLTNYQMTNEDLLASPGYSYNNASACQMMKIQNIDTLIMHKVRLLNGDNIHATGSALSFRFENTGAGISAPNQMIIKESKFAEGFRYAGHYPQRIYIENSEFGSRFVSEDALTLFFNHRCADYEMAGCKVNLHGGTRVFLMSASHAATDQFKIRDTEFVADKATDVYLVDPKVKDSIGSNIGHNNTFTNAGAGDFTISSGTDAEDAELSLTTDRNGAMLFDDTLIGTGAGAHPDPGVAAPYFTGMPVPANGRRIFNINWSPDATQVVPEKGWISHGGEWKELT